MVTPTPTTVQVKFQLRIDTAATWASVNPVLLSGEMGLESDTNKFKIGNGSTAWNSLGYFPFVVSGGTVTGNLEIGTTGTLTFEGSSADNFETTLGVINPTADRTINLPNVSGTIITTGDTGTVTSTMIADGTIVNADINASAAIAHSKLATITAGYVLIGNSSGVPTATQVTGDVTISDTGVTAISSGVIIDADVSATAEIAVSKLANGTANQVLVTDGTDVSWSDNLTLAGDLTVNGTTTTINTQDLLVEDKNIIIGNVDTPDDTTANNGGITLKGTSDKTINWLDATDSWTSSENIDLANGKSYRINDTEVLSATTLGSGVTSSSLTSVGTISSGTWQGTAIDASYLDSTVVTTSDTGTVTSTMIADGTIVDADVSASAAIAGSKIDPDFGSQTVETTGVFSAAAGSNSAPSITFTGDLNTGIYSPGADQLALSTNGTGRLFVDASGRTLIGMPSSSGSNYSLQVRSDTGGIAEFFTSSAGDSPYLGFSRSKGTATSPTVVASGDRLGTFEFLGYSGSAGTYRKAGEISCQVDGEPDTGGDTTDMPGRLVFSTTPDGASSPSERLRITSAGLVGIGSSSPEVLLHLKTASQFDASLGRTSAGLFIEQTTGTAGSGNYGPAISLSKINSSRPGGAIAAVQTTADDDQVGLAFLTHAGASSNDVLVEAMRITHGGLVGIGTSPSYKLHVSDSITNVALIQSSNSGAYIAFQDSATSTATSVGVGSTGNSLAFYANSFERGRFDPSGRLLVGTSSARSTFDGAAPAFQIEGTSQATGFASIFRNGSVAGNPATLGIGRSKGTTLGSLTSLANGDFIGRVSFFGADGTSTVNAAEIGAYVDGTPGANDMPGRLVFSTTADGSSSPTERARITAKGHLLVGKTAEEDMSVAGFETRGAGGTLGMTSATVSNDWCFAVNRLSSDGDLILLRQATVTEGTISVSGTTVSYNGAHLSRWSQLPGGVERIEILRGTVLSNIDEMCEWGDEDNEQLNRMKVSDVEGDKNVSGVFQAWDDDDDTYTNDFYCAMTGDFVIRIAAGVTVERGDLLMSAGDGTAKPQDDDIIRSKTIAKVTSTNVSCTHPDGSYCVPCVLMAC